MPCNWATLNVTSTRKLKEKMGESESAPEKILARKSELKQYSSIRFGHRKEEF